MNPVQMVCWICCNSEQKLQPLDEWSINCFQNVIGHQLPSSQMNKLLICVNCKPSLLKFSKFQDQVKNSYEILTNCSHQIQDIAHLECPAKLKIADLFNIAIYPDGSWKDLMETVKQEPEHELPDPVGMSDPETDPPVVKVKRKKKKRTAIVYKEIEISEKEIKKEREILARQEDFVNAILKCEKCLITFANQADLNEHSDKKHDQTLQFKCSICHSTFHQEVRFNYHRNKHIKRYECTVCLKRFTTQNNASKHYYLDHDFGSNMTKSSPKPTIDNEKLEVNANAFKCDICPKKFKFRSSLRKHTDTHMVASGHKRKPTCETCGLSFTNTANLQKHIKTSSKHQIQLKLKKQETQPAEFKLNEINLSIQNRNVYRCRHCDRAFQWKGNLSRHMKSHIAKVNGELLCSPCGRVFSSIATYQQHMKYSLKHISENDFKYMCSDCGGKFVNKTKLTDHINWEHLKKYQHVCTECKKIFKSHTSLYVHTQFVHKKTKEYLCDLCGKSFPMKSKLVSHIEGIHRRSGHSCQQCGASFAWSSCLSRHHAHAHRRT